MALELPKAIAESERDDNLHIARLLLLLSSHSSDGAKAMEGLTKLAKLDFLLRYPANLERALSSAGRDPEQASVESFERTSIETKMIRFRYGPWDHRYRRWLALMAARGLVKIGVEGRTVMIWLTDIGLDTSRQLAASTPLSKIAERASIVELRFGKRNGTALKNFIYQTFPELLDMKWGEQIAL